MEIINKPPETGIFQYALFDFDGTLSLIREGWQDIMIPYFIEVLLETPESEDENTIKILVTDFVDRLTGKQTIFQCMQLDDEVVKRGGKKRDPGLYKTEYLRRLHERIKYRIEELQAGCDPEKYIVPGGTKLLDLLQNKGCRLYLASGTDEKDVLKEAELLGLTKYFGTDIYGAHDSMTDCSKEMVINEILLKNDISGSDLLSFGDGFVEIELVSNIGGYSVGAATDEAGFKDVDPRKRQKLIEAGADIIVPDFSESEKLVSFLFERNR